MPREPHFVEVKQVNAAHAAITKQLDQQAKALANLSRSVASLMYDKELEAYKEAVREQYRQPHSYSTVVLGIGYAGAFALWSLVKGDMSPVHHALVALLIGFSLGIFVIWEVVRMMWSAISGAIAEKRILAAHGVAATKAEVDAISMYQNAWLTRLWPWQLGLSLSTGLAGVCLLLFALVRNLVAVIH